MTALTSIFWKQVGTASVRDQRQIISEHIEDTEYNAEGSADSKGLFLLRSMKT